MCYASEIGGNLFRHYFDSTISNTLKLRVNSFEPCFIHIGLCDTTRNSIFISWNMCYSQFNILSCVPAEIWLSHMVQNEFGYSALIFRFSSKNESRWYICVHFMPLLSNPNLGLEHWNSHSKGYRPDIEIPSSYPGSPYQIEIIPFGQGHLTLSWTLWTVLAVSRAGGQLWWFPLQIQNLFKKRVWIQVEPSWLEQVTLPSGPHLSTHHWFSHIGSYSGNFKFPSSDSDSPQK
jgi:hypothetical protein